MAIVNIDQASVRSEGPDYNKFDFQKGNNKARIVIPHMRMAEEYVHSVYRSEANMVQNDKGQLRAEWEGSTYAGSFRCTGDPKIVERAPSFGDPENCAACASLHNGPKVASNPKKQFALNVLRFQTKPNSFEIAGDGVTVELWKHGNDRNVASIMTALNEYEAPVSHLDFTIETDGSMYKKLTIQGVYPAKYGKIPALKAAVEAAVANLYSDEDLMNACGEKVSEQEMENTIRAAVAQATAGKDSPLDNGMFSAAPEPTQDTGTTITQMASLPEMAPAADLAQVSVSDISSLL